MFCFIFVLLFDVINIIYNYCDISNSNSTRNNNNITISLGIIDIRHHLSDYDFNVSRLILHPNFTLEPLTDNIGMIKLDRTIEFRNKNSNCSRACLPLTPSRIHLNMSACLAVGWGVDKEHSQTDKQSNVLLKVPMPILKPIDCTNSRIIPEFNQTTMICAGWKSGGSGACFGDIGGPLICPLVGLPPHDDAGGDNVNYNNTLYYSVVGILAANSDCALPKHPSVFMKIEAYNEFILKYTNEEE